MSEPENTTNSQPSKFCYRCGADLTGNHEGHQPSRPNKQVLPWAISGIAILALIAMLAGQGFNSKRGSGLDAPQNALPQAGLDDRGMMMGGAAGVGMPMPNSGAMRGPDISKMSPKEMADRLFNRIMTLNSQGKRDSVAFFAPMAIQAYQNLPVRSIDERYNLGRVAEVAGALPLAKAQADTILDERATHLLGLILASRVAALSGNTPAKREYDRRLLDAEKSELVKKLPEYERHADDISKAIQNASRIAPAPK